jgi:hypothetical protein
MQGFIHEDEIAHTAVKNTPVKIGGKINTGQFAPAGFLGECIIKQLLLFKRKKPS